MRLFATGYRVGSYPGVKMSLRKKSLETPGAADWGRPLYLANCSPMETASSTDSSPAPSWRSENEDKTRFRAVEKSKLLSGEGWRWGNYGSLMLNRVVYTIRTWIKVYLTRKLQVHTCKSVSTSRYTCTWRKIHRNLCNYEIYFFHFSFSF